MDAGFSDLVLGDNITIKSGCGIARFTPNGVELEDGTALQADAVIFACVLENYPRLALR
jgi:putative flavoprotein involved in K+ transport